jgi:hypothetical protein
MVDSTTSSDTELGEYIPFRPALTGPFAKRFYDRASHMAESKIGYPEIETFVREELKWVADIVINPKQRRIYRAVWLLLRDLLRVGWHYQWMAGTLEVVPPYVQPEVWTPEEIEQTKELVRQAMAAPRLERIADAHEFIKRVETPSPGALLWPGPLIWPRTIFCHNYETLIRPDYT